MVAVALAFLCLAALGLLTVGVWAVASELHRLADHHMRFPPEPVTGLAEGQELWINGVGLFVIDGFTEAGVPTAEPAVQPGIVTAP